MPRRTLGPGLKYLGLGTEFAAAVAGLTLVGYWVDRHFGTRPWGLLIGAGLGLVGGMYNMLRDALSAPRSERK
jgi:F0F1-type ATP synthase assembly protein I